MLTLNLYLLTAEPAGTASDQSSATVVEVSYAPFIGEIKAGTLGAVRVTWNVSVDHVE